jgi:hypothetical protein
MQVIAGGKGEFYPGALAVASGEGTMRRQGPDSVMRYAVLAVAVIAATAGCASVTTTSHAPPATHLATPAAATSSTPPSPSPSPSTVPCDAHSCIASDAEQLVGSTASDGSVISKMSCDQSTVHHAAPGVWTVDCTATYTDGSQWYGIATVLISKSQVSWQPQYQE